MIVVLGSIIAAPFGGLWAGFERIGVGGLATPIYANFPVSFDEASRVVLLSNLIRWAIWSPFMVFSAALAWRLTGDAPARGALFGVEVAYVAVSLEPLFLVIRLDTGTSAMKSLAAACHLAVWTVILILAVGSITAVFTGFELPGRMELWLPPVLSCAVFSAFRFYYNRGQVDLTRHPWF